MVVLVVEEERTRGGVAKWSRCSSHRDTHLITTSESVNSSTTQPFSRPSFLSVRIVVRLCLLLRKCHNRSYSVSIWQQTITTRIPRPIKRRIWLSITTIINVCLCARCATTGRTGATIWRGTRPPCTNSARPFWNAAAAGSPTRRHYVTTRPPTIVTGKTKFLLNSSQLNTNSSSYACLITDTFARFVRECFVGARC